MLKYFEQLQINVQIFWTLLQIFKYSEERQFQFPTLPRKLKLTQLLLLPYYSSIICFLKNVFTETYLMILFIALDSYKKIFLVTKGVSSIGETENFIDDMLIC